MCFFFASLEQFNKGFSGLFGKGQPGDYDEGTEGADEGTFASRFGWIYNAKRIADFENISLDEAYNLPLIQALNDLSYLKEYEANEKRIYKDARDSEQYGDT